MNTGNNSGRGQSSGQMQNNVQRPQNKDNLDSREGLEQTKKGDHITHNKKETRKPPKTAKK